MTRIKSIAAIFVILFIIQGCAINPVTGKKQISFMSESQEIAMGKNSDPAIIAQFGLYPDDSLQAYIEAMGQQMATISHRSELDYEFKVLDSEVVNAFAVPGGYIYFTRGIMAHFNNEAQFMGVLGHEIGHVAARHSAQQYTKQMLAQIGFMAGMIASEKFREFGAEAMQGMQLLFLKFSRSDESESDVLGVYYSSQLGYDAREMAGFFNTLDRMSGGSEGRLPEFMSTHPDPGRRYQEVNRMAEEHQANDPGKYIADRDGYLDLIDGIVYGADPRQGYVENNVFYHPELKFEYPIPRDWQVVNSPQQVQMGPEDGKALMVLMVAQEESIASAAAAIKEKYGLTNIQESNRNINGLSGYRMVADYPQVDPYSGAVAENYVMQTVLIEYNDLIYLFHGLTGSRSDYNSFKGRFDNTMLNFKVLNDPFRINVKPERIKIVEVTTSKTLQSLFDEEGIPSDRHEEMAVLNGMVLTDMLTPGSKVKSLTKDHHINEQ